MRVGDTIMFVDYVSRKLFGDLHRGILLIMRPKTIVILFCSQLGLPIKWVWELSAWRRQ